MNALPHLGMILNHVRHRTEVNFLCTAVVAHILAASLPAGQHDRIFIVQPGDVFFVRTLLWALPHPLDAVGKSSTADCYPKGVYDSLISPYVRSLLPKAPALNTLLYLKRPDGTARAVENELALSSMLERYCAENDLEFSVFVHQGEAGCMHDVFQFQRAKVVVGVMGGAICNVVFCQPETLMIEIVPQLAVIEGEVCDCYSGHDKSAIIGRIQFVEEAPHDKSSAAYP